MKVVALVQARMGSTRLPNKVMKTVNEIPMIGLLLGRLARAKEVDQIIVVTSIDERNKPLVEYVQKLGYTCEKGNENDVLDRYLQAAKKHQADVVVRITGDCPLVDPVLVDEAVKRFKSESVDYLCNNYPPTFPDGLDIEVFTFTALEQSSKETKDPFDREHVTPYLRTPGRFKTSTIQHVQDLSAMRWTVDELADFIVIERIFRHFHPRTNFSWLEVHYLQEMQPKLVDTNKVLIEMKEPPWLRVKSSGSERNK